MRRRQFLRTAALPAIAGAQQPRAQDFIKVRKIDGIWWLIDPEGQPFVSTGVNHLEPGLLLGSYNREATLERYGEDFVKADGTFNPAGSGARKWVGQIAADLKDWGFNSLGFHNGLPRPLFQDRIYFSQPVRPIVTTPYFPNAERPDVFSAETATRIDAGAREVCTAFRNQRNLIGYVYNDRPIYALGGGPGGRREPVHPWVGALRALPRDAPGRKRWLEVLRDRHSDAVAAGKAHGVAAASWDDLLARTGWPNPQDSPAADADHAAFMAAIAEQWFKLHAEAIRKYDPNHLILGDKLGGGFAEAGARPHSHRNIPDYLYPILAKYVDVVLVEWYGRLPDQELALRNIHNATGKPVLLGDSSFSQVQPRQDGAKGIIVGSQKAVGEEYATYLQKALALPFVLGWHFCGYIEGWTDPARPTRFQPQNGFKDPFEKIHEDAVVRVRAANRKALQWHRA